METKIKKGPSGRVKTGNKPSKKIKKPSSQVGFFRWLKKAMLGKSHLESMDLLDQWILKKRAMSLFF